LSVFIFFFSQNLKVLKPPEKVSTFSEIEKVSGGNEERRARESLPKEVPACWRAGGKSEGAGLGEGIFYLVLLIIFPTLFYVSNTG
jgi:hypothetical protein